MSSAVYFVRQLGKVRGPFAPDHLGRLVAAGLIGPTAEVSTDRAGWCPLEVHPGFGGSPAPEPISQRQPTRLTTFAVAPSVSDNFELDLSALLPPAVEVTTGTGSEWFDSVDLDTIGDE